MKVINALFMASIMFCSTAYAACVQHNNSVGLVGLDSQTGIVFAATNSFTNECACAYVRFKPDNTDTKMALDVLLAAKTSGTRVRIDILAAGNCDSGYRVYLH